MTFEGIYAFVGALLFVVGLHALILRAHLLRKILALNIMGSGVFLVIGALASPAPDGSPDAVAQALVITGIVVAIAATALALALMQKLTAATGTPELAGSRGLQAPRHRSGKARSADGRLTRTTLGSSPPPPP